MQHDTLLVDVGGAPPPAPPPATPHSPNISILDEPIDVPCADSFEDDCWYTSVSRQSFEEQCSYANANYQNHTGTTAGVSTMSSDPFDTTRPFQHPMRYYSHVAPEQVFKPINTSTSSSTSSQWSVSQADIEDPPVKKFDSKFLSELEKHLGQKEACANTHNTWSPNTVKSSSGESIPALSPPPQPQASSRTLQRKPSNVTIPTPLPLGSLVQNSWATKSVNIRSDSNRNSRSFVSTSNPDSLRDIRYGNVSSEVFSTPSVNGEGRNESTFDESLAETEDLVNKMWISRNERYSNSVSSCHQYNPVGSVSAPHQYDPVDTTWSQYAQVPSSHNYAASRPNYSYTSTGGNQIRENKLRQLKAQMGASGILQEEEFLAALENGGWDVPTAVKQLKLDSLARIGLVSRHQCEAALAKCDWNLDQAASFILDSNTSSSKS